MKIKTMMLVGLMGVVVLFLGREFSSAQAKVGALSPKIAIVSVRKAFLNCKANARYRADVLAEQSKINAVEAQQKFNSQQMVLKDRRWTEQLYEEILRITKRLAEEKGLDLVLERDEPEFPVPSPDELMMTLSTHKVLYSAGCVDITDELVARMDASELRFKN